MTLLLQELIVGVATGAIYALIALGYTMVYGIIELINFAHGDIFMIGSMVSIAIFEALGISGSGLEGKLPTGFALFGIMLLAVIGAMAICAILGVVIEIIAYRPLRNAPRLAPLISAIGVSLVLEDLGKLWKGNTLIAFPQVFPSFNVCFGPQIGVCKNLAPAIQAQSLQIATIDIFVLVVALGLMG